MVLINQHRFCLNLENPYRNETLGNFLVVSDNTSLSFNMWIKEGSAKQQSGNQAHKGFKKGGNVPPHQPSYPSRPYQQPRGGYRGGYHDGGYRGGPKRGGNY